ncbi:MAG: hypothetical protein IKE65_06975 [Clostridia bacterium]|nr:hypothetical protein [Clostridia bacterium]
MKTKVFKVITFNVVLLFACRLVLSTHFLGAGIHAAALNHPWVYILLLGIFAAIAAIGNYCLLHRKRAPKTLPVEEKCTPKNYIKALHGCYYKNEFSKQMSSMISQIERLNAKQNGLLMILERYFDTKELTYLKYRESIEQACDIFYANTREFTATVMLFDEKEYRALRANRLQLAPEMHRAKVQYYDEQFRRISALLYKNEEIITTLDNLCLSLEALSTSPRSENEKKQILEELRRLTAHTKQYV